MVLWRDSSHQTGSFRLVKLEGAARISLDNQSGNAAVSSLPTVVAPEDMKEESDEEDKANDRGREPESNAAAANDDAPPGFDGRSTDLPVDETVKKAVEAIDAENVSIFSYAIMSGHTDAVEFVYDLVIKLFEPEDPMVRDAAHNPCFHHNSSCQ